MKITAVEAIPFAIPYVKPLKFASGEVHTADHVLVRVHTDDGVVGIAEAPPRPFTYGETQAGIIAVIDQIVRARRCVGLDADRARSGQRPAGAHRRQPGREIRCRHGDLGCAGTHPRAARQRACSADTPTGCASATCSASTDPAAMVAEAERMRDLHGITTFKVKVGRRPVTLDTAVVRALRDRFGDSVELYVDGNRGWTAAESLRAMKEMADLDLLFAEELCPADDVVGRRWLVERLDVPFIADESVPTPADVTREVLGKSATAISIKTARTGFTTSERVHHLAEGLGLEVVMGNQIDGQIGSACAVTFGAAFQLTSRRAGELSNFLDMSDDLLAEPLRIRDGLLRVPPGAGLGIDIDPDKLAHYRTDRR